jgi:aldehyde dehydrogenase (NAD+)
MIEENLARSISEVFQKQKARSLSLRKESIHDRKKLLKGFEKHLLKNRSRIEEEIHKDFKKPVSEIDISELYPVLSSLRHTVSNLADWSAPVKIDAPSTYLGTRSEVCYEPKGTCLIIAPWNFPFNLCLGPLISCLAAGNTAIVKPSEMTPHTARLVKELLQEYFELDRVFVVEGDQEISSHLLSLPFDHIFFTGSPGVGKIVMKAAAENLSSVTLELGGKSPCIIDSTANLKDAARRIAFGKFLNNGQTCIAPDYLLVEESVQSRLIDLIKRETQELFGQGGEVAESSSNYGRIVNRKHFDRLNKMLTEAVDRGAKIVWGGITNQSTHFFQPTILTQVPMDAKIMEEEIFGPVLPILTYKNRDEVIGLINSKPKPLALYVFTGKKSFYEDVLSSTSSGTSCVNDCVVQFTHPNLPFGGVNNSGIGKAHGKYGFQAFSNEKPVLKQKPGTAVAYFLHPPHNSLKKKIIDTMLRWL